MMNAEDIISNGGVELVNNIKFHVGETEYTVNAQDVGPSTTLNTYLRDNLHLSATKNMCFEGGCGSCIVAVQEKIDGKLNTFVVNSCLVSILSCHGWKILTNEGIGNPLMGYHNLQKLLAFNNGSQCGFCSSGMIMNMYALQQSGKLTKQQIENSFGGNLCRCTGYRSILEAFRKLASDTVDSVEIEDLHLCKKEDCKRDCPGCTNSRSTSICFNLKDSRWVQVYTLANLLSVLKSANTDNYMLVGGNTARGVYHQSLFYNPDLYVDITKVAELTTTKQSNNTLILGANTTLTKAIEIFNSVSATKGFQYLAQMRDHLELVAHIPVRNIGTLAGNLMIKHEHNEFPSDVFLLMVTFKATLVIVDLNGTETTVAVQDFLEVDMKKKVMKSIILSPIDDSYLYYTYKIMPRAQNAHAMVNAGFLVKITNNVVDENRIVYGGINPDFVRASNTESMLKGQKLFDNSTLKKVFKSLDMELNPNNSPPDPTPEYRKNLAIALFYKFILRKAPSNLITPRNATGGQQFDRPLSTGSQEYGTQKEKWPLSEPVIKLEALAQTSGQAKYIMDLPDQHDQLFAEFVLASAAPGSVIQSTDNSDALKIPGVVAYYDYKSIPGRNEIMPIADNNPVVEELFCSGTVQYYDQPIGIVVATSYLAARQGASKVKVYYSPPNGKPLLTVQQVLEAKATDRIKHQSSINPTKNGNDVKHVIKGTWNVKGQYHFHMEVQCVQIIPIEDGLDMYPSTQWMDVCQRSASNILNIPMKNINVYVRRLGGAFGGKVTRTAFVSSAAALAAYKLRKPVKMQMPFESNMRVIGKRLPFYNSYEVGVNDSGVIQYLKADLYSDYGVGGNENMNHFIVPLFENCYDYSRWNFNTYMVNTDTPANTYMRAPGSLEAHGSIEGIMEHIAAFLDRDAFDVKMNNWNAIQYPKLPEFWTIMQRWANISARKTAIKDFNKANRWRKKGMSVVPMAWLLETTGQYPVLISIYHGDGTVVISHGGIEMGQGINTKVAQVTAYKLGITLDKVSVKPGYNVISPNAWSTNASLTSEAVAYGAVRACDELIRKMAPVKITLRNPTWVELVNACYAQSVFLNATGFYSVKEPGVQNYRIFGLCASEVEVDILTGEKQINRVDIIEDVGDSMSPLIDMGQCEGAFVIGIGHYTTENLIMNEDGKILNARTWNYKPPGAKDIPVDFRIKFPENNPNPLGILKTKAVAEPPLILSVSIPLAIRNAIASARTEANSSTGKWVPFDGPTTVEYTFLNSMNSYDQYTL